MKVSGSSFASQNLQGYYGSASVSGIHSALVLAFNRNIKLEFEQKLAQAKVDRRSEIVGTPEQQAIWDYVLNGTGHLLVNAVAGSGKSTTILELLCRLRVPYVDVRTFHQFGLRAINDAAQLQGIGRVRVPDWDPINDWATARGMKNLDNWREIVGLFKKLVGIVKGSLVQDSDEDTLARLADHHGLDTNGVFKAAVPYVWGYVKYSGELRGDISFDDMPWLPVRLQLPVPKYDLVLVDESQDTNPVQAALIQMAAAGGRVVVVGDRKQAIYGFRGAGVRAMDTLKEALEVTRPVDELGLTYSWRCTKQVAAMARCITPQFTVPETAVEGKVVRILPELGAGDCGDDVEALVERSAEFVRDGDMALCRVNGALITFAYAVLKRGVKCVIRGRDIGAGLARVVEQELYGTSMREVAESAGQWYAKERDKLAALGERAEARLSALYDKYSCIMQLLLTLDEPVPLSDDGEFWDCKLALVERINMLFADVDSAGNKRDGVVCGTVHRMKGLEAERVFIIRPDLMPHPMSVKRGGWELEQERNLAYVAVTRVKHGELWFAGAVPDLFREVVDELGGEGVVVEEVRVSPLKSKDKRVASEGINTVKELMQHENTEDGSGSNQQSAETIRRDRQPGRGEEKAGQGNTGLDGEKRHRQSRRPGGRGVQGRVRRSRGGAGKRGAPNADHREDRG